MLLEKVVEVGRLVEAQAVAHFGNIPVGVLKQGAGFAGQALGDVGRSGFARTIAHAAIEVVDVYRKLPGKVAGRAQGKAPVARLNRKLPLQQFQKHGGQPRFGIGLSPTEELLQTATADSLYVLKLATPCPYEEQEIRRLSPALHAPGSLLAVYDHPDAGLLLWGVLRSPQPPPAGEDPWPAAATPVPRVLLLDVRGPGHLVCYCGNQRLLTLQHGHVEGHGFVDYPVAWSWGRFTENLDALRHWLGAGAEAVLPALPALAGELAHHITRRVVTRVRASGHGGLVAFVPTATLPGSWGRRPRYGPSIR